MWRVVASLVCAVLVTALPAPALAQTANGQLAVVLQDRIVAVNPDGTGLRSLYTPPSGGEISGPAWSPDGNKLAFIWQGKVAVFDVATRKAEQLTNPGAGEYDADPAWSVSGDSIGYRRVGLAGLTHQRRRVALTGTEAQLPFMDPGTTSFAYAPGLGQWAFTIGPLLFLSTLEDFPIVDGATGTPAWSRDGRALTYVDTGSVFGAGLTVVTDITTTPKNTRVTALPAKAPRWAPDGNALAFLRADAVFTVRATKDATPVTVPGTTGATAVDWQPCTVETTVGCRSVLPPTCSATTAQVTTLTDQPVELPAAPCTDPAGLQLTLVLVKDGDHGSLTGSIYTPRPGFVGQDSVTYRVTNGSAASDTVRVTVFVVPRPVAGGPTPSTNNPSATVAAPFLSARVKPTLDRKRTTLARLACDQACTFTVRLEATLRGKKKPLRGTPLKRTLAPGRLLALRLKLPAKPQGTLKTVFITGTVRGANGASRPVKLAVTVRR
ncbi:Ig-like domain-containing protein [Solirubrobacter taibaiensis]|nr:Ig-like domain-containing protein [Solirubrobacter taibaiensis]